MPDVTPGDCWPMSSYSVASDGQKQDIVLFSGSSHPELAKSIAARLGLPLAKATLGHFSNQETSIQIDQSVRNADVYIIQSFHHKNVNDMLMEMLVLIHACKIASARKVTAVLPYFPYSKQPSGPYDKTAIQVESLLSRQDPCQHLKIQMEMLTLNSRMASQEIQRPAMGSSGHSIAVSCTTTTERHYKTWRTRNGKLIANMIAVAGADHVITMDLHDAQYQGFFDIPVDNLKAYPIFTNYIRDHIRDIDNAVIVSPDAGGAKRAIQMAQLMGAGFALIHKERRKKRGSCDAMDLSMVSTQGGFSNSSGTMTPLVHGRTIVGDVKEKTVIIVDDIADTCNTLIKAAQVAVAYGAKRVLAFVSHGIFSGNALDRLMSSPLEQVVITHSIPIVLSKEHEEKIKTLDLGYLFAETIRRIHYGESVSMLFHTRTFEGGAVAQISSKS